MTANPSHESRLPVRVGIGLIRRGRSYLIRRRPEGSAMAGYWEFPGGKCEPDETPEEAALRECHEETGLEVVLIRERAHVSHTYTHGHVELFYYDVMMKDPEASPDSSSGFLWVDAKELPALAFPDANAPVLASLALEADRAV